MRSYYKMPQNSPPSTVVKINRPSEFNTNVEMLRLVISDQMDQFRYVKIEPNTVDLRTRLWGINPTNSVVIPQSLVLRSIVLG